MTLQWSDLLLYCGALLILFLTPGPVWLALMARSLSGGFRAAWPLAVGVAIGDIVWPLVAILGISWILSVFDTFMLVLRWVACGVFVVMGAMLIRHAGATISTDSRLTRPGIDGRVPGWNSGHSRQPQGGPFLHRCAAGVFRSAHGHGG
ncbi:LysE family transporter [Photobacterium sp. TY 1-4]|uniref:LysE family transporter n=1 Tax=Pseudosulfitobacter koreensis TaxID=2968472 RepID=A0ABT1YWY7_9RHOB|nr:LysE family transporter [Pseudosulfitobacter koreense]